MAASSLALANTRREERDEVYHHAGAITAAGRELTVLIVNLSPNGLMARCDVAVEPGECLSFRLRRLALPIAEVRWSLGGRIGCEFERPIAAADYYPLLQQLAGTT